MKTRGKLLQMSLGQDVGESLEGGLGCLSVAAVQASIQDVFDRT